MAFYGIPIEKKYPLDTEDDVRRAIADFNNCQHIKRKILIAKDNMVHTNLFLFFTILHKAIEKEKPSIS